MAIRTLRLGVAGLGRAFSLMLPTFRADPRVRLVAACDPRAAACERFAADFGGTIHESVDALCADASLDAIYVATPHALHAGHAVTAARAGKHVLVEKPIAISIADAETIAEAADAAGVHVIVGPSHSFDAPIGLARRLVATGELGRVRMITAINYTDFLYRPRRPEELDTARGGGVVFSQAAHQVDVVRLLAGGRARSVRAMTGSWDPARPTEGAYGALVAFEDGAFASISYSGYAHFDSDELMGGIGELGRGKDASAHGAARRALGNVADALAEADAKAARNYGGEAWREPTVEAPWHEHFGFIVVSCERGDLRPTPRGVEIHGDFERRFEALEKPAVPRAAVIDELHAAVFEGRKPLHDARWGLATLEVCVAMLESSRRGGDIHLLHQVGVE